MIMKSTPGVDFINVLQAAFAHANPKSTKKTDGLTAFFMLWVSAGAKAAHKMLMKLTTGHNLAKLFPFVITYLFPFLLLSGVLVY